MKYLKVVLFVISFLMISPNFVSAANSQGFEWGAEIDDRIDYTYRTEYTLNSTREDDTFAIYIEILNLPTIPDIVESFSEVSLSYADFNVFFDNGTQIGIIYWTAIAVGNWDLMEEWKQAGLVKAEKDGITLLSFFECPEEIIKKYMQIYTETFNQQPIGELEGRPKFTPETRRLDEKRLTVKGVEWYSIITKEKDEIISGLTECFYYSQAPHKIDQGLTGVKIEFRGRGLGKWLKAEMILYIKKKFPSLKYISTMNATQNAAMLSINERMGFKELFIRQFFKFKLKELDNLVQ